MRSHSLYVQFPEEEDSDQDKEIYRDADPQRINDVPMHSDELTVDKPAGPRVPSTPTRWSPEVREPVNSEKDRLERELSELRERATREKKTLERKIAQLKEENARLERRILRSREMTRSEAEVDFVLEAIEGETVLREEGLSSSSVTQELGSYLQAVTELQHIIDKLRGKKESQVVIRRIEHRSPISVGLEGSAEAVRLIVESITPWRKQHSQKMARIEQLERQAIVELKRAEALEMRARAEKERKEAKRIAAEAAAQIEEARKARLENEKAHVELQREKANLALKILEQVSPGLSREEKVFYMKKLLPVLDVLISSQFEMKSGH
jgi:hypothetical protein